MDHFLICGICAESYSDSRIPLVLQCGHTFCSFCLSIIKENRIVLKCPIDRLIEGRPLNEIKRNISLLEMVEFHSQNLVEKCNAHHMKKAKFICFDCRSAFCTRCVQTHVFHRWTQLAGAEQIFNYFSLRKENLSQIREKIQEKIENFRNLEEKVLQKQQKMVEEVKNKFLQREYELRAEKEMIVQRIFNECSENVMNFQRFRMIINDCAEKIDNLLKLETEDVQGVIFFEDECSRIENTLKLVESAEV
jgi:hypothetical protein